MMKTRYLLILMAAGISLAALTLIAKQRVTDTPGAVTIRTIDSRQLADMLKGKDFTLINVHIPYSGEIAGTDAFIAYDSISEKSPGLPRDKSAKIILYCKTGRMSRIAAEKLVSSGYRYVYDLSGGMDAWQVDGYPILRNGENN